MEHPWCQYHIFFIFGTIGIVAIGAIVTIVIPEKSIAIEWFHWIQWSPMATATGANGTQPLAIGTTIGITDLIAIGAN